EADSPLRHVRQRRPHLLAVDDVVIAVLQGGRSQRAEVAAGAGLAEALAPDLFGGEDLRQVPLLLVLAAVYDDRRPRHPEADDVDRRRRLRTRHLLLEDRLLQETCAPPAARLRPR